MSFLNKIFKSNNDENNSQKNFWNWFERNSYQFWKTINSGKNIENDFFEKLSPELEKINEGIYFLTGMLDDKTAELILTADGIIKNIVFVEGLVSLSPKLSNWKFTALKPSLNIEDVSIEYENKYIFSSENLWFTPIIHNDYPDEIDILIQYENYNDEEKSVITNGVFIFLDNFLGELTSATVIDTLEVQGKSNEKNETIPIAKLKEYLNWRESEFTQKFQNTRRTNTDQDAYSSFEAKLENDLPYLAIANTSVLEWKDSPSHPWILRIDIEYDGNDNNGLPNDLDYNLMNDFEDDVMKLLIDKNGYINVGRETADNLRQIYFACIEFRNSSKVVYEIIKKYHDKLRIDYVIYKDKYWQTFDRFKS